MPRAIIFLLGVLLGVWAETIRAAVDDEDEYTRGLVDGTMRADRMFKIAMNAAYGRGR